MENKNKNINYLNRDFNSSKQALMDYAKTYYPQTFNDFSPASPGVMFIEMVSYISDVLSFYQESQFQELFTQYAKEKDNLYTLAYMLGYRPKVTKTSIASLDVYQLLPSTPSASVTVPDFRYAMVIEPGLQVKALTGDINFLVKDRIDFSISSSTDPTDLTVYSVNGGTNLPDYYLLKKNIKALSGTEKTTTFDFGDPSRFPVVSLQDDNIIEITSVVDINGNKWYEVPYLAQETIYDEVGNLSTNDPNFYGDYNVTPYLLKLRKVPRRFTTRFKSDNTLELQFGAGITVDVDEIIVPNPENVGLGIADGLNKLQTAYDPSNFLYTKTYGVAPYNTSLTVKYTVGGGAASNVSSNTLTDIVNAQTSFKFSSLDNVISTNVIKSLATNNPSASVGGGDGDTLEDLRLNTLASFPSQQRAVSLEDYIVRTYNLPSKFGTISKAYITSDIKSKNPKNPLALSLYVLSLGQDGKLACASQATKQNLKTYLSQFRMLTDGIDIKDAFIIDIGVNFDIVVLPNFNNQQVIIDCITILQDYFDTKKWQLNQPIILSELYVLLDRVQGVQFLKNIEVINKTGESLGYSKFAYDIQGATRNRVVYPSLDPSIFQLKLPAQDIQGRTVAL